MFCVGFALVLVPSMVCEFALYLAASRLCEETLHLATAILYKCTLYLVNSAQRARAVYGDFDGRRFPVASGDL